MDVVCVEQGQGGGGGAQQGLYLGPFPGALDPLALYQRLFQLVSLLSYWQKLRPFDRTYSYCCLLCVGSVKCCVEV